MKKVFSNYRINKNVSRKGVNLLMKNLRKRTTSSSVVVFTAVHPTEDQPQENWIIEKSKSGKFTYYCLDNKENSLKSAIMNLLTYSKAIVVVLVCDMQQKIDKKKYIKEMWGYRIINETKETVLEEITSEDIYSFSTININTGKSIPHQKEIVYCGPDGKICGWDID